MRATLGVFGDVARNRGLRLLTLAFTGFVITEYAVWIAMLVYAFDQGGVTASGLVALAQLLPAAVVAPFVASMADRRSPVLILAGGYAVQAVALAATAVFILAGSPPWLAYLGAVVAATAVVTTRPAQAALVPALTREVRELTATNVVLGWVDSFSLLVAGGGVGLALAWGSVGSVFAVAAVLMAAATWLALPLRSAAPRGESVSEGDSVGSAVATGVVQVWRSPPARLLVGLIGAEFVVVGALDVLFVVMAVDVLRAGQAWVGYLNMAYGAGGLVLASLAVLLIGRRLGPVIVATALLMSAALALAAFAPVALAAAGLLALVGGSHAVFDLSVRALLQRTVAADMVARIFGLAEGLSMAGLAVGSLLAPTLVEIGGGRFALVGVSALLPLLVLARVRVLRRIDQHAQVPVVEISLLRSLVLFRELPPPALEGLARALERVEYPEGTVVIREGDEGDLYYVVVDGTLEISRAGEGVRTLGRGDGLGEIALLRAVRRTATAVATTPVTAYTLDRDSFLTAVTGHVTTLQSATRIVDDVRAQDDRRDSASEG